MRNAPTYLASTVALSITLFGCSSSSDGGATSNDGGSDDASAIDGGLTSDAAAVDSGATEDLEIEVAAAGTPTSCSAFCASEQYTCVATCSFGDAGTAAGYAEYENSSQQQISTCSDVPATTLSSSPLNNYLCCCQSPVHQEIDGPTTLASCNDVCAAHGLKCDPFTIWDGADTTTYQGGVHESYTDGMGATTYRNGDCSTVPSLTWVPPDESSPWSLGDYVCGCD